MSDKTEEARRFASRGKEVVLDFPETALAHIMGLCMVVEAQEEALTRHREELVIDRSES